MSKNIDLFNKQTAQILAILWENFPVLQEISYAEFGAELPENYVKNLGWGNESIPENTVELRRVIDGTFNFLGENGYIKYKSDGWFSFNDVRLTEKGLAVLEIKLESLGGKETMGDRIISAVKDGTPAVIAGAVTNILSLGVNLITSGH
ncbi:hypothetical protein [Kluyvera ascorbata]|uniref:hypothetical protein n=1 Tax=Kluyvera ascorbata TaxID=51288 RepID=UPI0039F5756D